MAFVGSAAAAVLLGDVNSLLTLPCEAPIESATIELDLLTDCVAQSACPFLMRSLLVPACPTSVSRVCNDVALSDSLLALCAGTRRHCRAHH
jgi:hypothetical protein